MVRANTTRTGAIRGWTRSACWASPTASEVWVMENTGYNDYDALNLLAREALRQQLVGPSLALRCRNRVGRRQDQSDNNTYRV